jgi:hypothetical protein
MLDTKPRPLNLDDWEEIVRVPAVREAWGLTDEDAAEFAAHVYAAKFHFVSGSPGYVGDLYVLQGDPSQMRHRSCCVGTTTIN